MNQDSVSIEESIVATGFEDGEGVLVDLNTKRYYQLNETAMLVWQALEKNVPLHEIVEEMTNTYDVTPDRARASLEKLIAELSSYNLVRPT